MSRPAGVTASAVVAMLGSVLSLLFAVMVVAAVFIQPPQTQPPNSTQMALAGAAIMVAFGSFGIWTSLGLFRLRQWARTSIMIFAGFTAVWSFFGLMMMMIVPVPPELPVGSFRLIMGAMFGIPVAIAIWWLIQFNTPSTKAAFASPLAETESPTPLSITIIGWMYLLGGGSCLLLILLRQPAFLFGAIFNGWTAGVFYAFMGALSLYIGKGLLDLRERVRILAIAWFGFWFVHVSLVSLVPSLRQRMFDLQRGLEPNRPNPIPFDQGMFTNMMVAFSAVFVVTAIWFLVRDRAAFVVAETPGVTGYNA